MKHDNGKFSENRIVTNNIFFLRKFTAYGAGVVYGRGHGHTIVTGVKQNVSIEGSYGLRFI